MILVAENATEGHRAEYLAVVEGLLHARGTNVRRSRARLTLLFSRDAVFFMMIEEATTLFFLIGLLRALWGRRTAGLLFRPDECLAPTTLQLRLKRAGLRLFKLLPRIGVVTILPFSLNRRFETIARYGIYDLQFWDLKQPPAALAKSDLVAAIDRVAGSRKIVAALGSQNVEKAFDYFCKVWCAPANAKLRAEYLFVSGGRVAPGLSDLASEFERNGGVLIDRPLTDEELSALYLRSDLAWCCYAPHYNQSSGIFGRAVQYGVPAVARKGSYVASLANSLGHPALVLNWDEAENSAASLLSQSLTRRDPIEVVRTIAGMKSSSLASLERALGIRLQGEETSSVGSVAFD